jgi:hypothetical protein
VVMFMVLWWREKAQGVLPTVRPKAAAAALRRRRSSSGNWRRTVGRRALASNREACAGVDWGGGELVRAAHGRAVCGRSGEGRRRGNVARMLEIECWE